MSRRSLDLPVKVDNGKRLVVLLMLILQTALLAAALWPTCWLLLTWAPRVNTPHGWVALLLGAVFLFNYAYLVGLLGMRALIPYPKPGFYPRQKDGRLPREALIFMLNVTLVRMRMTTPWARMFTSPLADLPPITGLYRWLFGPHTTSLIPGDIAFILDPHLVHAGSNVQFGFASIITCHFFDQRGLWIKEVNIGDHVLIGGDTMISPGVKIGSHSIVAARSFVMPNTVIGEYEYWAGSPATKIKDLRRPRVETSEAAPNPTADAAQPTDDDDTQTVA